jgi:isoleucyl-tRNA synthetase
MDYIKISAPFMPFLSEYLYSYIQQINTIRDPSSFDYNNSVHNQHYPTYNREYNTKIAFERLQKVSKLIRIGRSKSKNHPSVKIPLKKCTIYHHDNLYLEDIKVLIDLIQDEVNCLEFDYSLISDDMITYKILPNNKAIGQTFKKDARFIVANLDSIDQSVLKQFYNKEIECIDIKISDDNILQIREEHVNVSIVIMAGDTDANIIQLNDDTDGLMLSIDTLYDKTIHDKYQTRQFIVFVQNYRKVNGYRPINTFTLEYVYDGLTDCAYVEYLMKMNTDIVMKKIGTMLTCVFDKYDDKKKYDEYVFEDIDKNTYVIKVMITRLT